MGVKTRGIGSQIPWAKMTEEKVRAMRRRRERNGVSFKRLADEFGVSFSTARCICERKTWRHVA